MKLVVNIYKLIVNIFGDTDRANWRDAGYWLSYTLIGGLAPIWCGYFISRLFSHPPTWGQFSEHGEFALYTAAIVAPAFHTVSRDLKVPGFKGRQLLLLSSFFSMFVAVCIYVAVSSAYVSNLPSISIDKTFLRWTTFVLFLFSIVLVFCVTVLDYARLSSDVREVVVEQREDLRKEFKDLQERE